MKVIDLYKKIANGPILLLPKKIKFENKQYIFEVISGKYCRVGDPYETFEDDWYISKILNEEIEIIEDVPKENKKIEKLKVYDNGIEWCCNGRAINDTEKDIIDKLTEIIDKINGEE